MQKYRPEIDGLRAVAVLAVVLFHARLGCPGGYVGVDVFFVISGFLITSIILKSIKASEFKPLDFWERRIRRIAPALVVTIAATLFAAWFVYLPADLIRVGTAMVAQSALASNVYHLRATDYFGPGAESLPLLHTWSLAVEEQFYIVFPIALMLLVSWRKRWLNGSLIAIFLVSLGLAIFITPGNEGASFYLLPTRAWELLTGALLAAFPSFGQATPKWSREALSLGGLAAIGVAIFTFNSSTPFPGYWALIPCLGAAAFIWANTWESTFAGRVLAWRPFVFTGLISYSLYLIHWPLFLLSMYWFRDAMPWEKRAGLVVIAFLLAVLSWILVENPVRKKKVLAKRNTLFAFAGASTAILIALGFFVRMNDGFPSRFSPDVLRYAEMRNDTGYLGEETVDSAKQGNLTKFGAQAGPVSCLIWGDSHAMAITPGLDFLCKEKGLRGFQAGYPDTAPLLNFVSKGKFALKQWSPEYNEAVAKFAVERKVGTVIMAGVWSEYSQDPAFEKCLRETVNRLTKAGLKVVIMLDVARQYENVPWLLARAALMGKDVRKVGVPLEHHREVNRKAEQIFARVAGPNVLVLDPAVCFVDESGLWRAEYGGHAMYKDEGHLSVQGALRMVPLLEKVVGKRPPHPHVLTAATGDFRKMPEGSSDK